MDKNDFGGRVPFSRRLVNATKYPLAETPLDLARELVKDLWPVIRDGQCQKGGLVWEQTLDKCAQVILGAQVKALEDVKQHCQGGYGFQHQLLDGVAEWVQKKIDQKRAGV